MMSGGFASWNVQPLDAAQRTFQTVLGKVGCAQDNASCALAAPAAALVAASCSDAWGCLGFGPVADGRELVGGTMAQLRAGAAAPVPIIIGTVKDEGWTFASESLSTQLNASGFAAFFASTFGLNASALRHAEQLYGAEKYAAFAAAAATQFPGGAASPLYWAAVDAIGDGDMACAAQEAALAYSAKGLPAYVYQFDHAPKTTRQPFAYHACDIPYAFHATSYTDGGLQTMSAAEVELSTTVASYIATFARTGGTAPGGLALAPAPSTAAAAAVRGPTAAAAAAAGGPDASGRVYAAAAVSWPRYTSVLRQRVRFGVGGLNSTAVLLDERAKAEQCAFWRAIG